MLRLSDRRVWLRQPREDFSHSLSWIFDGQISVQSLHFESIRHFVNWYFVSSHVAFIYENLLVTMVSFARRRSLWRINFTLWLYWLNLLINLITRCKVPGCMDLSSFGSDWPLEFFVLRRGRFKVNFLSLDFGNRFITTLHLLIKSRAREFNRRDSRVYARELADNGGVR